MYLTILLALFNSYRLSCNIFEPETVNGISNCAEPNLALWRHQEDTRCYDQCYRSGKEQEGKQHNGIKHSKLDFFLTQYLQVVGCVVWNSMVTQCCPPEGLFSQVKGVPAWVLFQKLSLHPFWGLFWATGHSQGPRTRRASVFWTPKLREEATGYHVYCIVSCLLYSSKIK